MSSAHGLLLHARALSEAVLQELSAALSPPVVLRTVLMGPSLDQVFLMVTATLGYSAALFAVSHFLCGPK
jgi:hypothetical protein